jgi:hypothetical protein
LLFAATGLFRVQSQKAGMQMTTMKSERAQALIIVILILIGIAGFAVLAIDGGRVYAERRRMQSTADTAAYAAAMAAAKNLDYRSAALSQAKMNQFDDGDSGYNPGQFMDVQVYNPPIDGPFAPANIKPGMDPNLYFQVKIRSRVEQIFSQFINRAPIEVNVEAVSFLLLEQPLSGNHAVIASSPNGCRGLWFQGEGGTVISGGNIFSNSNQKGERDQCFAGMQDGDGGVDVLNGAVYTVGKFSTGRGSVSASAGFKEGASPLPEWRITVPDCLSLLPIRVYESGSAVLEPGYYPDGIVIKEENTHIRMRPGVYCLDNALIMPSGQLEGQDVLLIIKRGAFFIGENTQVALSAQNGDDFPVFFNDMNWDGMLLFMPPDNTENVHLGGSTDSFYSGTIYAPGPSAREEEDKCIIVGSGASLDMKSSINCFSVKITGRARVTIDYQAEHNFYLPPQVSLVE